MKASCNICQTLHTTFIVWWTSVSSTLSKYGKPIYNDYSIDNPHYTQQMAPRKKYEDRVGLYDFDTELERLES